MNVFLRIWFKLFDLRQVGSDFIVSDPHIWKPKIMMCTFMIRKLQENLRSLLIQISRGINHLTPIQMLQKGGIWFLGVQADLCLLYLNVCWKHFSAKKNPRQNLHLKKKSISAFSACVRWRPWVSQHSWIRDLINNYSQIFCVWCAAIWIMWCI